MKLMNETKLDFESIEVLADGNGAEFILEC